MKNMKEEKIGCTEKHKGDKQERRGEVGVSKCLEGARKLETAI